MTTKPAVAYLRVSTKRQGLGIEAQREAVEAFIAAHGYRLVNGRYYEEQESGAKDDRPELQRALNACRAYRATLIVARLDRLSRDAAFVLNLAKEGIPIRFCDLPAIDEFTLGILAVVAQHERRLISERTRAALAVRKAQGVKLGGDRGGRVPPQALERSARTRRQRALIKAAVALDTVEGWRQMTARELADRLTALGVPTPSERGAWTADKASRARMLAFEAHRRGIALADPEEASA